MRFLLLVDHKNIHSDKETVIHDVNPVQNEEHSKSEVEEIIPEEKKDDNSENTVNSSVDIIENIGKEETPVEEKKEEKTSVEEKKEKEAPVEEKKEKEAPVEEKKEEEVPGEEEKEKEAPVEEKKEEEKVKQKITCPSKLKYPDYSHNPECFKRKL